MNLTCTRGADFEYKDQETGWQGVSYSQVQAVLDPGAFDSVPPEVLAAAQQRGTELHVLFGLLLLSRLGLCEKPERPTCALAGYFVAMEKFISDHHPVPVRVEESSVNEKAGYAGTPDCLVWLGKILVLIDLKTGGKRAVHKTQLVAYRAMDGYTDAKKLATLYVHADGTYKLDYLPKADESLHWAWFQAGLTVLNGRRMNNL